MIKYFMFYGHCYYASGGAQDFNGSYDTEEEARANLPDVDGWSDEYWAHLAILENGELKVIAEWSWTKTTNGILEWQEMPQEKQAQIG